MTTINDFQVEQVGAVFEFLDDLRESGETNMFGAAAYVQVEFETTRRGARTLLTAWMGTFDGESTPEVRATKAQSEEAG